MLREEKEVLMGARNTIIDNKPNLIIENELIHQNDTNDIFQITLEWVTKYFIFINQN